MSVVAGVPVNTPVPASAAGMLPVNAIQDADGVMRLAVDESGSTGVVAQLIQQMQHLSAEVRELRRVYCERTGAMFLDLGQQSLPSSN